LNAQELASRVIEKYASCSSYRDNGELKTTVPSWGRVSFETFFLAPKNLMVKMLYGAPEDPIHTETFWTNGTEFYAYTSGSSTKCERIRNEVDFYSFGMASLFDFEVPALLMPDAKKFAGRFSHCDYAPIKELTKGKSLTLSAEAEYKDVSFDQTFEVEIDRKGSYIMRTKSLESYAGKQPERPAALFLGSSTQLPAKALLLGKPTTAPIKLFLMLGKPGVFPMQDISTECIYHDVAFDEKISPALFSFSPPAES